MTKPNDYSCTKHHPLSTQLPVSKFSNPGSQFFRTPRNLERQWRQTFDKDAPVPVVINALSFPALIFEFVHAF